MSYIVCNPRPTQPNTVSASLGYLTPPFAPRYLLLVLTMLAVKSHPVLLVWLSVLYLTSKYRSGYVIECCDILLLILVGIYQILAGCLADSNLIAHWNAITVPPHAYVITVPHFVNQCLILLLTGYIALTIICNHTHILSQPKTAWSATTWSTQMKADTISPLRPLYVWAIHTTTV